MRALSADALTTWLTSTGAAWRPDDGPGLPAPAPAACCSRSTARSGAAQLVRDAVAAGVALVSLAPAGGALEQAYLTLEEDRR